MSKKSPLLIYNVEGGVGSCSECPKDKKKPAARVVHYNISQCSSEDKKEFKRVINKGMERFLCIYCFENNWKNNPLRSSFGLSDFTFVTISDWRRFSYHHK